MNAIQKYRAKKYKVIYNDGEIEEVVEMFDTIEEAEEFIMDSLEVLVEKGIVDGGYDLYELNEEDLN